MKLAVLSIMLAIAASSAWAHDRNCKGMPLDKAKNLGCCGKGDAHTFADGSHFSQDGKGTWHYYVNGMDYPIVQHGSGESIPPLPSSDGCYTIWYRRLVGGGIFTNPQLEIPPGTSPEEVYFYCLEIPFTGSTETSFALRRLR